jgi:hypothetical protein
MTDINCPICNRLNKDSAERCWYCQAVLHPEKEEAHNPDWLDGFRDNSESSPLPENEHPSSNDEPAKDVPDWLARIREREQMEQGESELTEQKANQDAVDWLRDISDDGKEQETPAGAISPASEEAPNPTAGSDDDWMKKLESWQSQEPPQDEALKELEPINTPIPPLESPSEKSGSGPDWLNEFAIEANDLAEPIPTEEVPAKEPEVEQPAPAPFAEETPASSIFVEETSATEKEIESVIPEEVTEGANVVKPSSSEPDWLSEFQALDPDKDIANQVLPTVPQETLVKQPFSGRDAMDWIDKDKAPVEVEKKNDLTPEEGELQPGALPPWLQELRPDKTSRDAEAGKNTPSAETSKSPLSEIDGILNGDSLFQFYTRPQTYSNTLKITPEQENQLERLQRISGEARWETNDAVKQPKQRSYLLRSIIYLLMIAVVIFALLGARPALITPTLYPQAVVKTYDTITALDGQQPVLIAADFDSSLYGELKWSSEAVLRQLMSQNVPITYLSTTPVGATLLQDTLTGLAANQNEYSLAEKTVNFGYLAGGTVGLQALAQDPRATLPLSVALKPAWEAAPFDAVTKVSDFGAVIVITENADTARYWIEQVKPSLGQTPLLVIISAQSAPMLQPYYDSGQVNGYIGGVSGSAAFEALSSTSGAASNHYAAYQLTLLVAAIMILVGGMISLVVRTPPGERSDKE